MRLIFWALLAAMTGVYLTMLLWSLPHLSDVSGGLLMFDMRPGGYTPDEAHEILSALGSEGRAFYLNVQHPLDTAYPLLMVLVLTLSFFRVYPRTLALGMSAIAIAAASFDYLENLAVATMLRTGPEAFSDQLAQTANRWTVLKSGAVTVALTALLIGLALAGWRKWHRRQAVI